MISGLMLLNTKGELVIYRLYRDDVSLSAANTFRMQVRSRCSAEARRGLSAARSARGVPRRCAVVLAVCGCSAFTPGARPPLCYAS